MTPVRTIEQIRHARLLQLIGSVEYPTITSLAEALGKSHAQVSQWKNQSERRNKDGVVIGVSNIDSASARFIEERVKKPAGWMDNDPAHDAVPNADERASSAPQPRGVAQPVSLETLTVVPILQWGQLMTDSDLPDVFKVAVPDHSMAPRFKKGQLVEFSLGISAEPGDGVLAADRAGAIYFREYRERRAGVWEAFAYNPSFGPMDAETDGLKVLAVLTGWSGRLSQ